MEMREGVENKHIQWFVWGAMSEWAHQAGVKLEYEYVLRTMNVVDGYVRGHRRSLDGSLSDLQCVIATEAKKLFSVEGLSS